MMDKRENNNFMTDFVFIDYSPNRRIIDDQQPIDDFELCKCYFCISFFEQLILKNKKMVGKKKVLLAGFYIVKATDHCINKDTQNILDSLTSLSLAKAYYSLFQPEHFRCWRYYCHLKHMIMHTIMDRGDKYKYLNSELKLDEFEEKGSPHPFYEEWLKNTTYLKTFYLKKIIYYKYYR